MVVQIMETIDRLIAVYEKRLAVIRELRAVSESDPEFAAEAAQALVSTGMSAIYPKRARRFKQDGQYARMIQFMQDGQWHTAQEIADTISAARHSIAPYLYRDDTKDRFESRRHPERPRMMQWRVRSPIHDTPAPQE